jgi:hypothetical protein
LIFTYHPYANNAESEESRIAIAYVIIISAYPQILAKKSLENYV